MKLPATTVIASEKIQNYLLATKVRNDKSKWLAEAGYYHGNWQTLENDLRQQILTLDAVLTETNQYGHMYEIIGELTGPNGKTLSIRSYWMNEVDTHVFKFITMFPNKM